MKKLIILAVLAMATTASADGFLQQDASKQTKIQGFAPNGTLSAVLTVNSVTYDMTQRLAYSIYSPADCIVRITATSSKTGSVSGPVIGGQWNTIVVNTATPFASISGCTNGYLRRQ